MTILSEFRGALAQPTQHPAECAGALEDILKLLQLIQDTPCSLPMAGGGGFHRSARSAGPTFLAGTHPKRSIRGCGLILSNS